LSKKSDGGLSYHSLQASITAAGAALKAALRMIFSQALQATPVVTWNAAKAAPFLWSSLLLVSHFRRFSRFRSCNC
jgi:hypothetical protein